MEEINGMWHKGSDSDVVKELEEASWGTIPKAKMVGNKGRLGGKWRIVSNHSEFAR